MKRLVVPVVLVLSLTLVPYARRGVPGRSAPQLVVGSRDRSLPGKARRRARRAAVNL